MCINNTNLLCFIDDSYLCICERKYTRAECFGYDHSLDQCSHCLAGAQCLKETSLTMEFRCLCPRCYSGQICQFNTRGLSFTLDSLIWQSSLSVQVIYLALSSCIFFIGGFTNYASFVTFKRPNPRKFGVGNYLLIVSLLNQCSLLSYLLKVFFIFFPTLLTIISCKIVSYVLSVSTRYNYWLTSWITLERVCSVLFPFNDYLKSPRSANHLFKYYANITGDVKVFAFTKVDRYGR